VHEAVALLPAEATSVTAEQPEMAVPSVKATVPVGVTPDPEVGDTVAV
jgi:hypothetical protein